MAAGAGVRAGRPALITNARFSKTLDTDQRNQRYLISMAVRLACFLAGCATPSPWNWVLFGGAAIIPPIAVLLANAIDQRGQAELPPETDPESERPALPGSTVVPGSVED